MARVSAADLVQKELKKRTPELALRYFSRLFESTGDLVNLEACARLLPKFARDPETFNSAFWSLYYQVFAKGKALNQKQLDRIHFKLMAAAHFRFVERLAADLAIPAPSHRPGPVRRVAVVSQQVLRPPHSPTMVALDVAATLAAHADVETLVVNASTMPLRAGSSFHPNYKATPPRFEGAYTMDYKGSTVNVFAAEGPAFTLAKLQSSIDALRDFAPDAVFGIGSCNVAADLASQFVPTMAWPSTQQEPIARAHVLFYRSQELAEPHVDYAANGLAAPLFAREDFNLATVPEKTETLSRADLKLPDDAFVYVIVGNRIDTELTPEYQQLLARVLAARPEARIVLVGAANIGVIPSLAALRDRITIIPQAPDIRALYDACDCFLNPPRQGGGNSAYIAMFDNMPIVTLDDCDVQMTIGAESACADLAAYEALAVALAERGAVYSDHVDRSRRRVAELDDPATAAGKLLAHAEAARERFNAVECAEAKTASAG